MNQISTVQGVRVGIVKRVLTNIGAGLLDACPAELKRLGVMDEDVLHVTVHGALEVPLALQKMAATHQFRCLDRARRCDSR